MESEVGDYSGLADLLWRERALLEQLLFELAVEQLVVGSGQVRWLPIANRRLQHALEQLRGTEIARSMESDAICDKLGKPVSTSLEELAGAAPEPWESILLEHRAALRILVDEVRHSAAQNQRLLDVAARSVRDTLASIDATVGTYDATGTPTSDPATPGRLDAQA